MEIGLKTQNRPIIRFKSEQLEKAEAKNNKLKLVINGKASVHSVDNADKVADWLNNIIKNRK